MGPYQRERINALITNYHLINGNIIKENEGIIITIKDESIEKKFICVFMIIEDSISMKNMI